MSYNLRYFFSFYADRDTRIIGGSPDEYDCEILGLDNTEPSEEIEASDNPIIITYTNTSDNKMQALRGSNCQLNLIATENFQLQDLYTENERQWLVRVYRNTVKIWEGFIIPDGCRQSFTYTPYTISVNAVDSLGLLKNLAYVQNDGNFFVVKQSFLEVIYNCLNRLGLPEIALNTAVNIYSENYPATDSDDPLALTYTEAERYLKDDEVNPMNCQEVLEAVLQIWTACIIQSEGKFYIYRPNEIALNSTVIFRSYTDNVYTGLSTEDLSLRLGGDSEGVILAPLFHINEDQELTIEKPYKNVSISYKFGIKQNPDEELDNPTFAGFSRGCIGDPALPCDDVTIPGWTKTGTMYIGTALSGGLIFFTDGGTFPTLTNYYQNDNLIPVIRNVTSAQRVKFIIDYENPDPLFGTDMNFVISLTDGATTWYLQADFTWAITSLGPGIEYYQVRSDIGDGGTLIIESDPVPSSGNITFRILAPSGTVNDIIYTNISANVLQDLGSVIGEIHTATQAGQYSFVPETINVLNGDSPVPLYIGAMYEDDETTLTLNWYRKYASESLKAAPFATYKPLLRLAVEELQRMYAGPYIRYDGSIFGYFNPLSIFSINLVNGKLIPVSLTYNLQENICKAVLTNVSNEEIDMDYTLDPDYGQTTNVPVI